MVDLSGRTAIVSGGARGIGAAVAHELAARGANVMVADLGANLDGSGSDAVPLESTAADITDVGGNAAYFLCDVGSAKDVQDLFSATMSKFGDLHIVVNAAGNIRARMIWNMTEEEWDSVIRVHLKGHFNMISAASRYWRQKNDPTGNFRIINFTSGAGLWGSTSQPNYSAAKMGIVGLTNSVALSLARYGATVNAIAPVAATRMTDNIPADRNTLPVSDAFSADNIAPLAAYLSSADSAWCSGRVFEAAGHTVKVYRYMTALAEATSDGRWSYASLASAMEGPLREAIVSDPNPSESLRSSLR